MPSGYNDLGPKAPVLNTFLGLTVTKDGVVESEYWRKVIPEFRENGIRCVKLPGGLLGRLESEISVSVANMVALAYKTPWFPLRHIGERANVIPIDGNPDNVHPENLLWKYHPEGIPADGAPELFYIPGFSMYLIKRDGTVVNSVSGKIKQSYISDSNYVQISITGEAGNSSRNIGIHRLLALTFIPYDVTVRTDQVNHKNINRTDNRIENLEWVSISENIKHARAARKLKSLERQEQKAYIKKYKIDAPYLEKLQNTTKSIPVESKNIWTDEVRQFGSISEAAKELMLDPETTRLSLAIGSRRVVGRRYIFRRVGEQWPNLTKEDVRIGYDGQARKVIAKNITTGELTTFVSAAEAIRQLGVSKKIVTQNLKLGRQIVIGIWVFQYEDALTDWQF